MKAFHSLKQAHPRLWCIVFCAIVFPVIPLALAYEIVVGITGELLNKIHELLVRNLFVRVFKREWRTAMKYLARARDDVVNQWKGHGNDTKKSSTIAKASGEVSNV